MTKYNNDVSPDPLQGGNRALYAKDDDYDFDGTADRRELSTSSLSQLQQRHHKQQQQQQPWRFVLMNYGANHSQKPLKSSHGFTLNQPPVTATQHHNLHPLIRKTPSHAAATQSNQNNASNNIDMLDENLDWINSSSSSSSGGSGGGSGSNINDDYDLMYDGNIPKTFSKYRYRRNSNPIRQTVSWQRF